MLVAGADPGVTGAVVIIDDTSLQVVAALDLPIVRAGKLAWVDGAVLADWLEEYRPEIAVVELVHTWAGNESTEQSARQRGIAAKVAMLCRLAGGIETVLTGVSLPFVHVTTTAWLRRAGIPPGLTRPERLSRCVSLAGARLSWPKGTLSLAKHHDRAAAALIALFGRAPAAPPKPPRRSKIVNQLAAENVPPGELFR